MNETEIDFAARLALHEYLLEQLFANGAMTATNPEKSWSDFSAALMDSIRFKTTAPSDAPELAEMHARMIWHAERLIANISERVAQGYR